MPQPRRGFHALSKGFSPHAQATHGACPSPAGAFTPSARASARTRRQRTAHAPAPQGLSRPQQGLQPARAGNARRMPQPRRGFHALSKGFSPHARATHGACPSPAGAFTPSARASARTRGWLSHPQQGLQPALQPARAGNARRMPQPRRGFHTLSKGFSLHARMTFTPSARASARTNSTFINPTVRTFGNRSTETLEAMSSGRK
jgi:hypothetical protein